MPGRSRQRGFVTRTFDGWVAPTHCLDHSHDARVSRAESQRHDVRDNDEAENDDAPTSKSLDGASHQHGVDCRRRRTHHASDGEN